MKDIKNYEGLYAITTDGKVYSHKKKKFMSVRAGRKGHGDYPSVSLYKDGKAKNYSIHRLVAITYLPNPDNLPEVHHKDHNRYNPDESNLEWVSREQNMLYEIEEKDREQLVDKYISKLKYLGVSLDEIQSIYQSKE